jgi:hypothetical protein
MHPAYSGRIPSQPLLSTTTGISHPLCWLVGPLRLRWALLCGPTSKPQNVLDLTPIAHPHTSPGMDAPSRHAERRRVRECRNHAKLEECESRAKQMVDDLPISRTHIPMPESRSACTFFFPRSPSVARTHSLAEITPAAR